MADPKTPVTPPATPPTPPATPPPAGAGEGVEATVRRIFAELLPKMKGGGAAAEHDVTAQVEAAVTKVHNGQKAEQVIADLQKRLTDVEKRPVIEKKPKEYRSITRRIWGPDDDE